MTSYVTDLFAYPHAFWTQGHLWPRSSRKHIFLADAVLQVGAAMFGPAEWTGDEPNEAMEYNAGEIALMRTGGLTQREQAEIKKKIGPRPVTFKPREHKLTLPSSVTGEDFSYHVVTYRRDKWLKDRSSKATAIEEGFLRVQQVANWIGDMVLDGEITPFGRLAQGGEIWPMPVAEWQVEPLWERRVRTCSLRRNQKNVLLFLDAEDFARCLSQLPFAGKAELATPAPPIPAAMPETSQPAEEPLAPGSAAKAPGRKRGRKLDPVWGRAFAKAYKQHRSIAAGLADKEFRKWIIGMNPGLGKQASPSHHRTIRTYRALADAGKLDHFLGS